MKRAKAAKERVTRCEKRLDKAQGAALDAMAKLQASLEARGLPRFPDEGPDDRAHGLKAIALLAYETHMLVSDVWSEISWLAEAGRELDAARKGRRTPHGPGWPFPGDVLNARRRRAERRAS